MIRFTLVLLGAALTVAASYPAGPAVLRWSPPVDKTIAAFPRVAAAPSDAAAARINRALAVAEQGLGCDTAKGYWNRSVAVTMRGPRYLSFLAHDDYYCSTAYPDTADTALVFDLSTGAPIDWKGLFPPGIVQSAGTGPGGGDSQPVTVSSKALWALYAKLAATDLKVKECRDVLADPPGTGLMLWPVAKTDGVTMEQAEFPHVVKACGPPEAIAMPELRKLGVSAVFLAALDEAHRRGWYDKTDVGKEKK